VFTLPLKGVAKSGHLVENLLVPSAELELSDSFATQAVSIDLELTQLGETNVLARGKARAKATLECSRCLENFDLWIDAKFLVEFEPLAPGATKAEEPALGDGHVAFTGEAIPLGEEIRQELELALPVRAICRQECKGLCPVCGAGLNIKDCQCQSSKGNNAFAGLSELTAETSRSDSGSKPRTKLLKKHKKKKQ
jgi:uncharacterized protein